MGKKKKGKKKSIKLPVDRLVPGLYIDLKLSWREHPFLFSRFCIKSEHEIDIIKDLGLQTVTVFPERSKAIIAEQDPNESSDLITNVTQDTLWKNKNSRIEQAEKYRYRRQKTSQQYKETIKKVKNLTQDLKSAPANAIRDAHEVVESIAAAFDRKGNVLVNLINLSDSGFSQYNHSLNVTVLSLNMASALGISAQQSLQLGVGAILHDIGKISIPHKVTMKMEKLTESEIKLLQTHPTLGAKMVRLINQVSDEAIDIIDQHHEMLDGSGYPKGLKSPQISRLAQIVTITDRYDELCNPLDPQQALTPKAAMAILYAKYKNKIDGKLVQTFIKTMGVYPSGTVVQLSDESIGLVVSVDPNELLYPQILLYNPDIPSNEALLLDLKEHKDISIIDALKPGHYPKRICEYLGIKDRLGYFYEEQETH